jgi:hypothetical protein
MKNLLKEIAKVCESDEELPKEKIDSIYEIVMRGLGKDKEIPSSIDMLKIAKKIIKKERLNITKLKINKHGNFQFLVHVRSGCYGDWCDLEILSPFIFYHKIIKPNLKSIGVEATKK